MQRKLKEDVKNVYSHNNYFSIIQNWQQNPEYSLQNHSIESRISIELFIQKIEENYSKFQNKAKIRLRSPPEAPV